MVSRQQSNEISLEKNRENGKPAFLGRGARVCGRAGCCELEGAGPLSPQSRVHSPAARPHLPSAGPCLPSAQVTYALGLPVPMAWREAPEKTFSKNKTKHPLILEWRETSHTFAFLVIYFPSRDGGFVLILSKVMKCFHPGPSSPFLQPHPSCPGPALSFLTAQMSSVTKWK